MLLSLIKYNLLKMKLYISVRVKYEIQLLIFILTQNSEDGI